MSPNCVSSLDPKPSRRVAPIPFTGDSASGWARLRKVIAEMKGARIAEEKSGYLHAEFRSGLFGFVDDVEFRLDEAAGRSTAVTGASGGRESFVPGWEWRRPGVPGTADFPSSVFCIVSLPNNTNCSYKI